MISRVKLYTQLDRLESDLEKKLIPHLERTAEGNNDLVFCVEDFNPFTELSLKTDKKTEALVNMGSQILALRKKLGESSAGSIAERICWYCHEWGDLNNPHRKSAQELAQDFLKEISMNKEVRTSKE